MVKEERVRIDEPRRWVWNKATQRKRENDREERQLETLRWVFKQKENEREGERERKKWTESHCCFCCCRLYSWMCFSIYFVFPFHRSLSFCFSTALVVDGKIVLFFFTSFDFESTSFYEQSEHYFSYSSFLEHYVSTTKFIHLTQISSLIYWSSTMFTIWIMIVVEHKRISSHWILMFEQQRKWINSGLKPRLLRSLWLHFNRPAAYFFPEHALQTYYKAMC